MNTINDRIARCIVESNLTKTAFAQKIGLTQAYVSALSIGRKKPSDRTISDICRDFGINEPESVKLVVKSHAHFALFCSEILLTTAG